MTTYEASALLLDLMIPCAARCAGFLVSGEGVTAPVNTPVHVLDVTSVDVAGPLRNMLKESLLDVVGGRWADVQDMVGKDGLQLNLLFEIPAAGDPHENVMQEFCRASGLLHARQTRDWELSPNMVLRYNDIRADYMMPSWLVQWSQAPLRFGFGLGAYLGMDAVADSANESPTPYPEGFSVADWYVSLDEWSVMYNPRTTARYGDTTGGTGLCGLPGLLRFALQRMRRKPYYVSVKFAAQHRLVACLMLPADGQAGAVRLASLAARQALAMYANGGYSFGTPLQESRFGGLGVFVSRCMCMETDNMWRTQKWLSGIQVTNVETIKTEQEARAAADDTIVSILRETEERGCPSWYRRGQARKGHGQA